VDYEIRFLDTNGEVIGDDSHLESEIPIPIPNVGEIVTAPRSGYFEITARVFSYSRSSGEKPSFRITLYCKKTAREK
jgi:hypothetical protein